MIGFRDTHLPAFGKNWGLFLLLGIALIILGCVAISAATLTTLLSVVLLGVIIFISGIVITIDTFTFWRGKWSGFFLHLLFSILYLAVGVMLIKNPVEGSISLTLLLGVFYLVIGVFRVASYTALRTPSWGWGWLNGVISLILGVLILTNWPMSGLYIIGLFIGIDLVFCGWTYVMASLAARKLNG